MILPTGQPSYEAPDLRPVSAQRGAGSAVSRFRRMSEESCALPPLAPGGNMFCSAGPLVGKRSRRRGKSVPLVRGPIRGIAL